MNSCYNSAMTNRNAIFINFMMREGWTHEEAKFELNFLLINCVPVTENYYLLTLRKGATRILSRGKRVFVYLAFRNACNHATFGV